MADTLINSSIHKEKDPWEPLHLALHGDSRARVSHIGEAIEWLCDAFDFTLRLRIGNHRAQLNVGDGAVVLTEQREGDGEDLPSAAELQPPRRGFQHSVTVRVENADRHHERAKQRGARILRPPADYPYGQRQYTAEDLVGRCWTFSQSIADIAPEEWGGALGQM